MWQIVEKFMYFASYPSETKTTIRNDNRLDFPAVTICNLNKFRKGLFEIKYTLHYRIVVQDYIQKFYNDNLELTL